MQTRKYYSLKEELSIYSGWVLAIAKSAKVKPDKVRRMFNGVGWNDKIYSHALKYRREQRRKVIHAIQQNSK